MVHDADLHDHIFPPTHILWFISIDRLRPLAEKLLDNRATLTTALEGMLEVR